MLTGEGVILRPDDVMQTAPHTANRIELEFLTPTSIKVAGRWTSDLRFEHLIRNLLRRIRLLSYFHCGEDIDVDARGLAPRLPIMSRTNLNLRWFGEQTAVRIDAESCLCRWVGLSVASASRATSHRSSLLFTSASIYTSATIRRWGMGNTDSGVSLGSHLPYFMHDPSCLTHISITISYNLKKKPHALCGFCVFIS